MSYLPKDEARRGAAHIVVSYLTILGEFGGGILLILGIAKFGCDRARAAHHRYNCYGAWRQGLDVFQRRRRVGIPGVGGGARRSGVTRQGPIFVGSRGWLSLAVAHAIEKVRH
jgi:hypothetical protein